MESRIGLRRAGSVLIIPGWNGSGPDHWQTLWAEEFGASRIEQKDWQNPRLECWIDALDRSVQGLPGPVTLVAHSLGCVLTAHWAARGGDTRKVDAALLVAPPCLTPPCLCPVELLEFSPVPAAKLPFPSSVVASENDPYLPMESARELARAWGSTFENAGRAGHINAASGHGLWPAGKALLNDLVVRAYEASPRQLIA